MASKRALGSFRLLLLWVSLPFFRPCLFQAVINFTALIRVGSGADCSF